MKKAGIYGAGGHAHVLVSILQALNIPVLGIFDDSYQGPETVLGVNVIGKFEKLFSDYRGEISRVYLALGDNHLRRNAFLLLKNKGFELPSLVHPKTRIDPTVSLADGSVVCIGSILGTEANIGTGCIINTGVSVDHESIIENFVHLAPKVVVAGRVSIGSNTFVGMNSCIADKLSVGRNVIIGAGSVVLKDVPDNAKVMGLYH